MEQDGVLYITNKWYRPKDRLPSPEDGFVLCFCFEPRDETVRFAEAQYWSERKQWKEWDECEGGWKPMAEPLAWCFEIWNNLENDLHSDIKRMVHNV